MRFLRNPHHFFTQTCKSNVRNENALKKLGKQQRFLQGLIQHTLTKENINEKTKSHFTM